MAISRVFKLAVALLGFVGLLGHAGQVHAVMLDRPGNVSAAIFVPTADKFFSLDGDLSLLRVAPAVEAAIDPSRFDSLAAAVAAQNPPAAIEEELGCLASAVYFEAKGEPLAGQLAVAQVILNRARSGRFPSDVCSVVTQPGQFSFVRGGHVPPIAGNAAYRTALAVAQVALARGWDDPAPSALYFHARRVAPNWRMTRIAAIGNHIFYR